MITDIIEDGQIARRAITSWDERTGGLEEHQGMLVQIRHAVRAILPDGWFELHSLGDAGFETGRDHCMLERVGGPPVGSFHVWCDDGLFHVKALPELDQTIGATPWQERYRYAADVVRAIAGAINVQLRAWKLPVPTSVAGG